MTPSPSITRQRTCTDCGASVSPKSSGRCRHCANQIVNRDPKRLAKVSASMRKRWADPAHRASHAEITRQAVARMMLNPERVEARRRGGLKAAVTNLHKGRTAEARAKAGPSISAAKLAHIPEGYRALYVRLTRKGWSAEKRLAYVLERKAADERARLSPHSAADHLRRFGPVARCDENGTFNPFGTHWRRSSTVLTGAELIERALATGWNPHLWQKAA